MDYRSARYIDETRIDCEIKHPKYGWVPYTLDPDDTDNTVDNSVLLSAMSANKDVAAHVPPTQEELDADKAVLVRSVRDNLLLEVDVIASNALRWADLTEEERSSWSTYRHALLDVPQQSGFPWSVTWPTKPSE